MTFPRLSRRLFALALIFTLHPVSALAETSEPFYTKNEPFPFLRYEEFRRLSRESQAEYLGEVQSMLIALEKQGIFPETVARSFRSPLLEILGLDFLQSALADPPAAVAEDNLRQRGIDALKAEIARRAAANHQDGSLRCIYAGFPIYGTNCRARASYKDPVNKKNYTCTDREVNARARPATTGTETRRGARLPRAATTGTGTTTTTAAATPPTDAAANEYQTILPDPVDPQKTVLCNPLLFGLKNGKPLCIARGASATQTCRKESSGADGKMTAQAKESALALMRENPGEYEKLKNALTEICRGPNSDENTIKTYWLSKQKTEKTASDLAKTCNDFGPRLAEFTQSGSSTTGTTTEGRR